MSLKIATWNINSVRLRQGLVEAVLKELNPDVLCLQETKCPPGHFPEQTFKNAGYPYLAEFGQKSYNGVAVISRIPLQPLPLRSFCQKDDRRHIAVLLGTENPITLHNFYIPAGGDEPDPVINEKFAHKLNFLKEMQIMFGAEKAKGLGRSILVGDLNIAPYEHDVWSHKDLLKIVSHTPIETDNLLKLMEVGGFIDLMRQHTPLSEKLYTWWSYRARNWELADRGRRLDHIWSTADIAPNCQGTIIYKTARGWAQPSDHVPVMAHFDLEV